MKTPIRDAFMKPYVLGLLTITFGVILYLGQACQINGGGYGGMKPGTGPESVVFENDGIYGDGERRSSVSFASGTTMEGANPYNASVPYNNAFYVFSETAVCSSLVADLGLVGNFVAGMIYGSSTSGFSHRASACASPSIILATDISSVDFDPISWIYQNQVYRRYTTAPSQSSDIERTVAYCRVVDAPNADGIETGTSVTIYRQGSALYASIYRGLPEEGVYRRYHMGPKEVLAQASTSLVAFTAFGFRLDVAASTAAIQGTGVLKVSFNSALLQLNMDCWRYED